MINIKKIVITYQQHPPTHKQYYAILTHGDHIHYCTTVVGRQGKFQWVFDHEILKITLQNMLNTIKVKLLEYCSCKAIDQFQIDTKDATHTSKNIFICSQLSRNRGIAELQIDYQSQNKIQIKKAEQISSYDRVSKRTNTTNYEQNLILPSLVHKVSSSKFLSNRQADHYNYGPYYSPKNATDYLKGYRQSKQTQRYESVLLRKSSSYKFLV